VGNGTLRIKTWDFETDGFHLLVAEISDGRVSIKVKPKDENAAFFATSLGDLIQEGNQMFVGDDLSVEWTKDNR
jgi:hypothetical protein